MDVTGLNFDGDTINTLNPVFNGTSTWAVGDCSFPANNLPETPKFVPAEAYPVWSGGPVINGNYNCTP
jgi:hypothetical protein